MLYSNYVSHIYLDLHGSNLHAILSKGFIKGSVSVYKKQMIKQTVGLEWVTEGMMLRIAGN